MTTSFALKIALGIVCFAIGVACVIGAVCVIPFISAADVAMPITFGAFGALFLWIAFRLLRQVRWHTTK